MAGYLRATFLFSQNAGAVQYGWSESYFKPSNDDTDPAELDSFCPKAATLLWRRSACLSPAVRIQGMRCSKTQVYRDSRFFTAGTNYPVLLAGTLNNLGTPVRKVPGVGHFDDYNTSADVGKAAEPTIALLVRIEAGQMTRRPFLMRGLPELVVGAGNVYDPTPVGWLDALIAFRNELMAVPPNAGSGPWYAIGYNQATPLQPETPIATLTTTNDHTLVVVTPTQPMKYGTPAPVAMVAGDMFQIRGVKRALGVNGVWKMMSNPVLGDNQWSFTAGSASSHIVAIPNDVNFTNARMRLRASQARVFDSFVDEKLASRRTGRPFGSPVGRRRRGS